ncbi:MAG: carboxylating nicotinate-nucleotide diphosphorylase, partial [Solirubrobacterales bacterium]
EPGVIFGLELARETFAQSGASEFEPLATEGKWRDETSAPVARISGPARSLLAGERVGLNFLAHLSGVATLTARFVEAVSGTGAVVLDTRKTTPGLRDLEKAAVVAGGGQNHRMRLDDAALIKENHIAVAGGIERAVELACDRLPPDFEVECRDIDDVHAGLAGGARRLLLDNMDAAQLRTAVSARDEFVQRTGGTVDLEASGGVTLENVGQIAATGVDYVSVGALTHSAPAVDLSMLIADSAI